MIAQGRRNKYSSEKVQFHVFDGLDKESHKITFVLCQNSHKPTQIHKIGTQNSPPIGMSVK
jgi:hypothetical protein